MSITASDISQLRAQTGAGILDCKKALEAAEGDLAKALDWLRERGVAKAAKRSGKIASEGIVSSYIHAAGSVGVLLELNCETDFVAKTDDFKALVGDIAMHIAAVGPVCVTREEVDPAEMEREANIYREQMKLEGKPEDIIEKIVAGKMDKYYSEVVLLDQPFVKDEDMTIGELLTKRTGEMGEKLSVRRFARFEMGEGIVKEESNLAADVAAELAK